MSSEGLIAATDVSRTRPAKAGSRLGPRRERRELVGDNPWTRGEVVRLVWFSAVGLIGLGVCYIGAAQEASWPDQRKWVVGAIAALMLAALGPVGWLIAVVHRVRGDARNSVQAMRRAGLLPQKDAVRATATAGPAAYFAADNMTMSHLSDCPLIRGKAVQQVTQAEIEARNLARCGVCQP